METLGIWTDHAQNLPGLCNVCIQNIKMDVYTKYKIGIYNKDAAARARTFEGVNVEPLLTRERTMITPISVCYYSDLHNARTI